MLVALATHNGDRHLSAQLAQHIRNLGGVRDHELLLVAPLGTNLVGIEEVFRDAFGRVRVHYYAESMRGWPWGANEAAHAVFLEVFSNPELPGYFLMLEPDCVPVGQHWLNYIDMAYRGSGGMPVLGVTIPTHELNGQPTGERHTVGVAVYPKDFPRRCGIFKSLLNMTRAHHQANHLAPWDVIFAPYVAKMTAQTGLIQHLYRRFTHDQHGARWDVPSIDEALAQVRPGVVLIHGCKQPEFLNRITGGQPHATSQRQIENRTEYPRDAQRTEVRPSAPEIRSGESSQNGHSGSHPREQKEVAPLTKAEIAEQKRKERAEKKRRENHENFRKEFGIDFPIDTPEFTRALDICISIGQSFAGKTTTWADTKAYGRELGLTIPPKWNKGILSCEITKAEKAQHKTEKWKVQPVHAPAPPPPMPELAIDPNFKVESHSTSRPALEGMTLIPNGQGTAGQIIPAGAPKSGPMIPPTIGMTPERMQQMRQMIANRRAQGMPA